MKVLIAEDDKHTREGLAEVLAHEGYVPICAADGNEAVLLFEQENPDFVCLDIMMPDKDGYSACREIRKRNESTPIVFISAKSEEMDKVVGLELGADDFIVKPFGVREVVARIRAVTRRCLMQKQQGTKPKAIRMADIDVFPAELRARRGAQVIELSLRDVRILELLYQRRGEVVDRNTFFDACWGLDHMPNSRTLDQHISQLRKRIELDPHNPLIIRTVHGVGYRFQE
ncbi:MAG: DNA-binding response regulator [Candidatus Hydrogenedentota bacterium]